MSSSTRRGGVDGSSKRRARRPVWTACAPAPLGTIPRERLRTRANLGPLGPVPEGCRAASMHRGHGWCRGNGSPTSAIGLATDGLGDLVAYLARLRPECFPTTTSPRLPLRRAPGASAHVTAWCPHGASRVRWGVEPGRGDGPRSLRRLPSAHCTGTARSRPCRDCRQDAVESPAQEQPTPFCLGAPATIRSYTRQLDRVVRHQVLARSAARRFRA